MDHGAFKAQFPWFGHIFGDDPQPNKEGKISHGTSTIAMACGDGGAIEPYRQM